MNYYSLFARYLTLLIFKRYVLGKTVEKMAVRRGDAIGLMFENERITFAQFNREANRRANFFHSLGVGKGEVVALMMENRPEYLYTLSGLAKLGAVTAAINTNLTGQQLIHCLNISGATRLIMGAECLDKLGDVLPKLERIRKEGIFVDTRWPATAPAPGGAQDLNGLLGGVSDGNPPRVALRSSDLLAYIYTSGTTGLPKAARISHLRLFAAGLGLAAYGADVVAGEGIYCPLPLYHSNGMLIAFGGAMRNGAALAISRRFRASQCWEEVTRFGATRFIYIGEVLRYLVNTPPGPYDRAHKVTHVLGNGLRPDIWKQFQERFGIRNIREFYASTEGNAAMLNLNNAVGSCGDSIIRPSNLALVRFDTDRNEYIRGADGFCQRCPPGEVGELLGHIKPATTPFGGYANAEETEKKLLRNVFKKGDVYFKTGDLLKRDEAGNHYFVDRIGDTFRWKGENVSTQEVQELVNTYPGIQMSNVFGMTVPGADGRAGMAVLVMNPGAKLDAAAFFRHTQEHLPAYARPAFVRIAGEAILTGTFKLKKAELLKEGFDPGSVKDPLFYRDEGKGSYLPLTGPVYKDIQGGKIRF